MSRLELTGKKIGRLTVLSLAYTKDGRTFWNCTCDCNPDKIVVVKGKYLSNGDTQSCGCINKEYAQQMGLNNKQYNKYTIDGDIVYVKFSNCDEEFICNKEDWEFAKSICWYKNNTGYARGEINDKMILFHDYIMGITPSESDQIDHINGDRLDNTRNNLRLCDRQKNAYNHTIRSDNTTGVTGVYWHKQRGKWNAKITHNKQNIDLGFFDNFQDAVNARYQAEEKYFKEYARERG